MKSNLICIWFKLVGLMSVIAASGCDFDPTIVHIFLHFDNGWSARGAKVKNFESITFGNFSWLSGGQNSTSGIESDFRILLSNEEFDVSQLNADTIQSIGLHRYESRDVFTGQFLNGFVNLTYGKNGEIDRILIQFTPESEFDSDYNYSIRERFGIQFRSGPTIDQRMEESELQKRMGIKYTRERRRGAEF